MSQRTPWVIGISGASGTPYAAAVLRGLLDAGEAVDLVVSKAARLTILDETGIGWRDAYWRDDLATFLGRDVATDDVVHWSPGDLAAGPSSGSYLTKGMAIVPASTSAVAGIALGLSKDLLQRAADVTLKERRRLVVVPRETPLARSTLLHLVELYDAGAVVLPAMPAFYHGPKDLQDLVDFVAGKVLDSLGVPHELFARWRGGQDLGQSGTDAVIEADGTGGTASHQQWLDTHPHANGLPAWLRRSAGESRVPVIVAIVAVIALQLSVPAHFALQPKWVLAALEGVLLAVLVAANPVRLTRDHPALRIGSLLLTAVVTFTNAASAVLLVHNLIFVRGDADNAPSLLGGGASIYLTNIIAFGLWYWEFDRGGPIPRAHGTRAHPDFLFPQMSTPELTDTEWEPNLVDYLYVSFTNATAFSPTDTLPLSRWAKLLMATQSLVALTTVGLVIARAVNVLGAS